jgi:FixJ family two-component response regulator
MQSMPGPIPTVFVVDDDPSIRESLNLLLSSAGYGVQTFSSAKEFLESEQDIRENACIVSDIKMPGLSGLDLQEELASRDYAMPIIFITGHGDIPTTVQAMKKGAIEFLPKPFDDGDLLDAVKEALSKDFQVRAVLNEQLHLTQRLTYLITGMLNKQIAYELNIAERTVKAHRKHVMDKMGVDSIAQLVRLTEKIGVNPVDVSF